MLSKFLSLVPYWSGILILVFLLSKRQKKISKEILWASFRTTIQLIFLAFALEVIFKSTQMVVSLAVALVMTFNSSSGYLLYRIFFLFGLLPFFSLGKDLNRVGMNL